MKILSKRVIIISLMVIILSLGVAGLAFAQDNGNIESCPEFCDGTSTCLQNCDASAGKGDCLRAGTCKTSEGNDICLQKRVGRCAGAGSNLQKCYGGGAQ